MAIAIESKVEAFLRRHPVGRLATADANGRPSVVPICFVLMQGRFYSPIDDKRKRVSWGRLKRLRNVEENAEVSLLVDEYSDDWSSLGYVLIRGKADSLLPRGRFAKEHGSAIECLREKYPPYAGSRIAERPLIRVVPDSMTCWTATDGNVLL